MMAHSFQKCSWLPRQSCFADIWHFALSLPVLQMYFFPSCVRHTLLFICM